MRAMRAFLRGPMVSFHRVHRVLNLLMVPAALFLASGCQSGDGVRIDRFDQAPLNGMVYDYRSGPVTQAKVTLDGERSIRTDINGRFVFPATGPGDHTVRLEKDGYETVTVEFPFHSKTQVLYVKMISLGTLLDRAEEAVGRKRWAEARALLDRAETVERDNPAVRYVVALLALYRDRPEEAAAILREILDSGYEDAVVLLSLADLHQYRLDQPERARRYLARYLNLREDEEVRERYERLEREIAADRAPMDRGDEQ